MELDWKIGEWPTIVKTADGDARRAQAAADKRKGPLRGPVVKVKREPSEASIRLGSSPTPTHHSDSSHGIALSSLCDTNARSKLEPSTDHIPNQSTSQRGHDELLFFEDLARYRVILEHPERTVTILGVVMTQLSRIDHVEQQLIERLSQLLERRHTEMDDLDKRLATLSARLAPASDQELDLEVPDDSEEDGERDED